MRAYASECWKKGKSLASSLMHLTGITNESADVKSWVAMVRD